MKKDDEMIPTKSDTVIGNARVVLADRVIDLTIHGATVVTPGGRFPADIHATIESVVIATPARASPIARSVIACRFRET